MATQKVSVTLAAEAIERPGRWRGRGGCPSYIDIALQEKLERDGRRAERLRRAVAE